MLNEGTLELGVELGRGGQGSVWDVLNVRWTSAPQEADVEQLVFKRYRPASLGKVDPQVLESMPRFWEGLSERDRIRLLRWVAWPLQTVGVDGTLSGFVMPQVSRVFFFERQLLSGGVKREMATMQFLLNDASFLRRAGIDVNSSERLEILKDLARALAFLHERDIVVGDISPMNVFWSKLPECRAFLIDADSMSIGGTSATGHPVATPDWAAPNAADSSTTDIAQPADDVFKLGLMVLRVLTGSQNERDPSALDSNLSSLSSLVEASLAVDPADRPSATEWTQMLSRTVASNPKLRWLDEPPPDPKRRPKRRTRAGGRHKPKNVPAHINRRPVHTSNTTTTRVHSSAIPNPGGARTTRPLQVRPVHNANLSDSNRPLSRHILISLAIVLAALLASFGITYLLKDSLICTSTSDESEQIQSASRGDFIGKLYNCQASDAIMHREGL